MEHSTPDRSSLSTYLGVGVGVGLGLGLGLVLYSREVLTLDVLVQRVVQARVRLLFGLGVGRGLGLGLGLR